MSRCTWAARALGVSIRCGDRPGEAWALPAVGGADDSRAGVGGERKRKQAALGRTHKQTSAGRGNGADAGATGAAGAAAGTIALIHFDFPLALVTALDFLSRFLCVFRVYSKGS